MEGADAQYSKGGPANGRAGQRLSNEPEAPSGDLFYPPTPLPEGTGLERGTHGTLVINTLQYLQSVHLGTA